MLKQTNHRASPGTRRTGYVIAILINTAVLFAIYSWPGWQTVPFLTAETTAVLGWVTASLIAGLVANVCYLVTDPPWLKSLGDVGITGIGLVAVVRVWQVFPFDFGDSSFDWTLLLRIMLAVGFFGSIVALIVQLVSFGRARR
ncbi:hypothetical protein ACWGID_05405 [Kribbella sp. NPDC054772]